MKKKPTVATKQRTKLSSLALKDRQRAIAARMLTKGALQHEIAAKLGVGIARVKELLDEAMDSWKRDATKDMLEYRAIELAKIDLIERTAWKAWHRSCKPQASVSYNLDGSTKSEDGSTKDAEKEDAKDAKMVAEAIKAAARLGIHLVSKKPSSSKRRGGGLGRDEYDESAMLRQIVNGMQFTQRTREGNPAFISIIIKCQERRATMLGIDESKRFSALLEFRVAGAERDEVDRQMIELVAQRMASVLKPTAN
jgi:predicted XRE-type DNA-binding protein